MRNSSNSACTLLRILWEIFVAWIWISLSQSMVTRQIWIVDNPSWCSLEGLLKWLYQQIIWPRPKHWPTCDITVKQPSIAAAPSGFPGFDDRNNSSKNGLSRQYCENNNDDDDKRLLPVMCSTRTGKTVCLCLTYSIVTTTIDLFSNQRFVRAFNREAVDLYGQNARNFISRAFCPLKKLHIDVAPIKWQSLWDKHKIDRLEMKCCSPAEFAWSAPPDPQISIANDSIMFVKSVRMASNKWIGAVVDAAAVAAAAAFLFVGWLCYANLSIFKRSWPEVFHLRGS